jgi:hypothetical protein
MRVSHDFVPVKRHQLLDVIQKASDTGIRQVQLINQRRQLGRQSVYPGTVFITTSPSRRDMTSFPTSNAAKRVRTRFFTSGL